MRLGEFENEEHSEQEECKDRYAEFGECDRFEIYDWEKKLADYRREIEKEELEKKRAEGEVCGTKPLSN